MRMLWGGVSLLVVLAIVVWLARTQLRQEHTAAPQGMPEAASAAGIDPAIPARDVPRKVQDDLMRAMQTAPARGDDAR